MFQIFVESENAMDDVWDLAFSFREEDTDLEQAYSMCSWECRSEIHGEHMTSRRPDQVTSLPQQDEPST